MASYLSRWIEVDGALSRLRQHRKRLVVSAVGIVLTTIAVPKMLPLWVANYAGTTTGTQLLTAKADEKVLSGVVFAGGYVREAIETAEQEREVVRTEREAFEEFAREVESMSAQTRRFSTPGAIRADVTAKTGQLQQVKRSYRETVMSVPDYDEAYGETLEEHLRVEFSHDLATVVTGGGQLSMPVKQLLVQQARSAGTEREQLLGTIQTECDSLRALESPLQRTDELIDRIEARKLRCQPFEELIEREHELRTQRHECEQLLAKRQQDLHENSMTNREEGLCLQKYLYQAMDVTFPGLSAILDRIERLDDRRRTVTRAIVRRD